jgi:hypothetical protein
MEVVPFPRPLSYLEPELFEAAFQRYALATSASMRCIFGGKAFQVFANHAGQGRIPINGYLADFLD